MKKPYNELTNSEKDKIVELFNKGNMVKEIPSLLNVSSRSVTRVLKERAINTHRINRYTLNEKYFDTIDTEEKAYILGLLFSDGFIGDEKHNNIVLSLTETDSYLLEIIKDKLEFTGELRLHRNHGYESQKSSYVLNFSSSHMCNSLRNLGLNDIKSKRKVIIPFIDETLVKHYIRGYFDGDGSFSFGDSKETRKLKDGTYKTYCYLKARFSIIIPEKFVEDFTSRLPGYYGIRKSHTDGLVYIENSAKNNIENIYNYLYKDSTIYLKKKHDKFLEYMEHLARDC